MLQAARNEIWQSWRRTCAQNAGHPRARELFDPHKLPAFHDPFAGGGSLPLEAQRLGLEAYASDLNPVAVLICKAMIEIPPKFAGRPPVNPEARRQPALLARAKNTSVAGMVEAGIVAARAGKVRLLRPDELPATWDPATDPRLTTWEIVHHLIRVLEAGGESAAAEFVAKLGARAETARELCYRLYTLCERKKRAAEALAYNCLVQSWPEVTRLARESATPRDVQPALL